MLTRRRKRKTLGWTYVICCLSLLTCVFFRSSISLHLSRNPHDDRVIRHPCNKPFRWIGLQGGPSPLAQYVLARRLRGGLVGGSLLGSSCDCDELHKALSDARRAGAAAAPPKGLEEEEEVEQEGAWRPMCRICYEEDATGLFAPCKCSGSMRFVHKECLRRWRAVNMRERGYTHCPMCQVEYKLTSTASGPPDTWLFKLAQSLATNECAVTATVLSLAVAVIGEGMEQSSAVAAAISWLHKFPLVSCLKIGPSPLPRRPGPWLPGKAPRVGGSWIVGRRAGGGKGVGSNVTPIDAATGLPSVEAMFDAVLDVEELVLRRLRYHWGCLALGTLLALLVPAVLSAGGVQVWSMCSTFVTHEADVKLSIASATLWWVVYMSCEVVFVHLHHFPRALAWTSLLYLLEGALSVPLQIGLQVYVAAAEQPSLSDVLAYDQETQEQKEECLVVAEK